MDPVAAALLGLGAATLLVSVTGVPTDATALFVLGAGLYGVTRATGRGGKWLAAPAGIWFLMHAWEVLPDKLSAYPFSTEHPTLYATPVWLGGVVLLVTLAASVAHVREKIGPGLTWLTAGALGFALFAALLALAPDKGSSSALVLGAMSDGWRETSIALTAACWLTLASGARAPEVTVSKGALAGAVGAALLAALFAGQAGSGGDAVMGWHFATLALGWVLLGVGLGAMARSGAGSASWLGVALAAFQVLIGIPLSLALADRLGGGAAWAGALGTALVFGLLGVALALLFSQIAALRDVRAVTAVVLLVAVYGGTQALLAALGEAFRMRSSRNPFAGVELYTHAAAPLGLVLFAGLTAFLAAPPKATASAAAPVA